MANYHLEVTTVSRGNGRSVTGLANYISGRKLYDCYNNKAYYHQRSDVLYCRIFLPNNAPSDFHDLQKLCNEIDRAEVRWDARTAREFKGSLPNELPLRELTRIVTEYIGRNFLSPGLCAIAAIHEGRNDIDLARNNPHAHIIVPTRTLGPDGFNPKKDREHDNKKYIGIWREQWADVQNKAYERNGLDIRVSHESLEVQGVRDREPTIHLSRIDWQREQRGERTPAGDRKRAIKVRNQERTKQRQQGKERVLEMARSR